MHRKAEFVDVDGSIRLRIPRPTPPSDVDEGFGRISLAHTGRERLLADFDAAELVRRNKP